MDISGTIIGFCNPVIVHQGMEDISSTTCFSFVHAIGPRSDIVRLSCSVDFVRHSDGTGILQLSANDLDNNCDPESVMWVSVVDPDSSPIVLFSLGESDPAAVYALQTEFNSDESILSIPFQAMNFLSWKYVRWKLTDHTHLMTQSS